jgi:hypothetical protein
VKFVSVRLPPTCKWRFRINCGHGQQKNPMSFVTPGFDCFPEKMGRASQAQRMGGLIVRRFIGESPIAFLPTHET